MDSCRMYKQKKIMGNFNIENEDFFKTEIAKVYIYILFCFLSKNFLLLRIWHFVKSILLKRFWNVLLIPKWGNKKKNCTCSLAFFIIVLKNTWKFWKKAVLFLDYNWLTFINIRINSKMKSHKNIKNVKKCCKELLKISMLFSKLKLISFKKN